MGNFLKKNIQIFRFNIDKKVVGTNMKKVIKLSVFIIGIISIWCGLNYILERAKDPKWDNSGLSYVYNNPDYYDVIFTGTSITITNISCEELYLSYGIAGVTIGEPTQPTYLSYYSLEEALKYQHPKAVMFDVSSLFYTEDELIENLQYDQHHHLHYTLDSMKNNRTKYEAFCQAKELVPDIDVWSYFSKTYYNHSNWENLRIGNFDRTSDKLVMNGNLMLFSVQQNKDDMDNDNTGDLAEIPEINLKYLYKMIDLCNEKNVPLILTRGSGNYTWAKYNAIKKLAQKYNIPYIDLNNNKKEAGINLTEDCVDGTHFNPLGAQKWTHVIGNYLKSHFSISDRRLDKKYNRYQEQEEFYNDALKAMDDMLTLASGTTFNEYLSYLKDLDMKDTSVFISVVEDASANLTDNEVWCLNEMGLNADLLGKYGYSYIGIFGEAGIQEELGAELLEINGKIGDTINYKVISGGYFTNNNASIEIDGKEEMAGGKGINIVVYNSKIENVISSVYFDTTQFVNPPTCMINQINQEQYEVELGLWLPLENYES